MNILQFYVLWRLENHWKTYSIPYGVGGRFSVFTEVGFVTAALVGFDIEGFLAGAASMDAACQEEDIFKNPALLSALLKYIASERYGRIIEVFYALWGSSSFLI